MENNVKVSVVIPCRNEEQFIGECLESLISNSYSKDRIEIFVVDGMSSDRTRQIVERYTKKYSFIKMLDNPKNNVPSAMNIGIRNSGGDIIMKVDAHSIYKKDYIDECIKYLIEYDADNVGGIIVPLPRDNNLIAKAIIVSISHPFGVGNSFFRINCLGEPAESDTVFSGCYKRGIFDKIGLYDENIKRSEDMDLNYRLKNAGGKIILVPKIVSYYYARSDYLSFIKHNFDNGFWITYPLVFGKAIFSYRHIVPSIFVSGIFIFFILSFFSSTCFYVLMSILSLYILLSLFFSALISMKEKNAAYLFVMPVIFFTLHFTYGLGSLWGLIAIGIFIIRERLVYGKG